MNRKKKQRAAIPFEEYPDIKRHMDCAPPLRSDISKNTMDAARLAMARWYYKVEEAGMHSLTSLLLLL